MVALATILDVPEIMRTKNPVCAKYVEGRFNKHHRVLALGYP